MRVHFGIDLPTTGEFADARALAALAGEAEAAGWDGFFLYDQVATASPLPLCDPWIALSAVALATRRVRLGILVTPLPRRRPWKLARETVSLDHLSGGRLIVGVGLGSGPEEFDDLGEEPDPRVRAAMLDEGLQILTGLWSGERFTFRGTHYQVRETRFLPPPLQTPRIPIWVGGTWPIRGPFRRAARWDGMFPHYRDADGIIGPMPPAALAEALAYVHTQGAVGPFALVLRGATPGDDPRAAAALIAPYVEAGLTWWLEGVEGGRGLRETRERIRQGPPHLDRIWDHESAGVS